MDFNQKDNILRHYYFSEKNPAAYSGVQKLFRVINKNYPGLFASAYIKQWLNEGYFLSESILGHTALTLIQWVKFQHFISYMFIQLYNEKTCYCYMLIMSRIDRKRRK